MSTKQDYNMWASTYDSQINPTRDLEEVAQKSILSGHHFTNTLDLGCGTGKNIPFLLTLTNKLFAVDQSENMIAIAKQKAKDQKNVSFASGDITEKWLFTVQQFDLITCSLILEHIQDLDFIFKEANRMLHKGGYFYIGELHPYKQYAGSKARFETSNGTHTLECYIHHISEYMEAAISNGFSRETVKELFDEDPKTPTPRIIAFLFRKK